MKKSKKVILIAGISVMLVVGCKEKGQVVDADKTTEVANVTEAKTSAENQDVSDINESEGDVEERWTKLWPGESMEVNLNAKGELIGGFAKDGNDMYKAVKYSGEMVDENAYCYFFSYYFNKYKESNADLSFSENLEDVSEELWDKEMSAWESKLGKQNGPFLDRNTLEIEVKSRERVTLNGNEFLREEVLGKSASMDVPKSSRFVAYYYLNEGGQGVCVFGDRSKEQTDANYENVKEVAEAIMSTFRE